MNLTKPEIPTPVKTQVAIFIDSDLVQPLAEIIKELKRAEAKHPGWDPDPVVQAAVVCEESGELIRAALQLRYENGSRSEFKKEAVETACTAIRLLKNLPF